MTDLQELLAAERAFDAQLLRPRMVGAPAPSVLSAGDYWTERVWAVAEQRGPLELTAGELARGFGILARPIFICGAHRSGTSLLRDLLDSHPSISMLPSEGTFFTRFEPRLRRMAQQSWLPWLAKEWLRRLANPINQEPYWLLGRSEGENSPYVNFARSLLAWWPRLREKPGSAVSSWPLAAIALAYAHTTRALSEESKVVRWSEKTPTNERFMQRLLTEFPQAQFIQLVRHPANVYASHKAIETSALKWKHNKRQVLREMLTSYRVAATDGHAAATSRQYKVIRYEDLTTNTRATMAEVAAFLEISPLPSLLTPTVAGAAALMNSSFALGAAPGRIQPESDAGRSPVLDRDDHESLAAVLGKPAKVLGYPLQPVSSLRAALARLKLRLM